MAKEKKCAFASQSVLPLVAHTLILLAQPRATRGPLCEEKNFCSFPQGDYTKLYQPRINKTTKYIFSDSIKVLCGLHLRVLTVFFFFL